MLNISAVYRIKNFLYLVYFAKDVEDWFGYSKLNVFVICHCTVI